MHLANYANLSRSTQLNSQLKQFCLVCRNDALTQWHSILKLWHCFISSFIGALQHVLPLHSCLRSQGCSPCRAQKRRLDLRTPEGRHSSLKLHTALKQKLPGYFLNLTFRQISKLFTRMLSWNLSKVSINFKQTPCLLKIKSGKLT